MNIKFVLFNFFFVLNSIFAQSLVFQVQSQDYSSNQTIIQLKVQNISTSLKSLFIQQIQLTDIDSILVFESNYSLIDKDPTGFYSIIEQDQNILFGLGIFEKNNYRFKIIATKNDDSLEIYYIN